MEISVGLIDKMRFEDITEFGNIWSINRHDEIWRYNWQMRRYQQNSSRCVSSLILIMIIGPWGNADTIAQEYCPGIEAAH